MMQAEKRVMEWKKTRVTDARSKKTATVDEVARDVKKVKEESGENDEEAEPEYFVLEGLTLVKMSTDPFYKSNLETDARAALRARKSVLLRSNVIDNGGYASDAKLSLQVRDNHDGRSEAVVHAVLIP